MRYEIRELDVGGILDQAIRVVKDRFWLFLKITVVLWIPFNLITGLMVLWNMPDVPAIVQAGVPTDVQYEFPTGLVFAVTAINFVLVYPLTNSALTYAVANSYLEKPISIGGAYSRAFRIILPLIGTWILFGLAIFAPFVVAGILTAIAGAVGIVFIVIAVVFAIVLGFWFLLAPQVVIIEGKAGTGALNRSKQLMKGNIGKAFVLGVLVAVINALCTWGPQFIPQLETQVVVQVILQTLLAIFGTAAWVVFYFSCRCKAENFDLMMLADAVSEEGPPAIDAGSAPPSRVP